MSSTSTAILSVTKPEFSCLFPQRRNGRNIIPSPILLSKIHLHGLSISREISKLSGFKSNGFRAYSFSSDSVDNQVGVEKSASSDTAKMPEVQSSIWTWKGYSIRYQYSGNSGPALVLVHGFGANSDHWRKNIPVLAKSHRVYSIDLIGYGYSDKPNPREFGDNSFYTFETWATQLNDFCADVIKDKAFFICNSIGGVNVFSMYPSKLILCYHDTAQVTQELVQKILLPGLEPGAVDVFLDFICYSEGPLPEELLPQVKCPVLIAWGDKDPWEPIELGRNYANFDPVEDFVVLPNVGHCPQDEAPHLVNPIVESFVARNSTARATVSTVT
ncbi:uncharacterized protein LOC110638273 isoform X1 [Hevea brasiliensis]|uniref:uncharacterized protein LOC110638273 isoform X1 n=1 Tax=Hevea brasiliensis TaxID=3981 RepID=UPI000B775D3A|nr:uncharacterized protein LOC110638273 isoform X1 [Hevea brasiliensis]